MTTAGSGAGPGRPTGDAAAVGRHWPALVLGVGLGVGLVVHFWLTGRLTQFDRLLDPLPYAYGDYSLHYYDAVRAGEALASSGRVWAWDPQFMAGYPSSVFDAVSNRTLEMLFWLAPGPQPVLFKLYVVLTLLLAPLVMLAAARLAGFDWPTGQVAALLTVALMQVDERLFTFVRRGLFQFPFANTLAVGSIATFLALARRPTGARAVAAGGLLGLTLLAHPTMALVLVVPVGIIVATCPLLWPHWGLLLLVVGLALVPNLPWMLAVADNLAYLGPDSGFWATGSIDLGQLLFADAGTACRNAIVGCGLVAVVVGGRRSLPYAFGAVVATVFGLFGSRLPIVARLEPARFVLSAGYLAILPAAMAITATLATRPRSRRGLVAIAVGLVLVVVPLARTAEFNPLPYFLRWTMPLAETADADALVEALEQSTDRSGRILLDQDWPGSNHRGFIGCYVGLRLERELIGGPHPFVKLLHNRVNMLEGRFLGELLDDVDDSRLEQLLRLYNVRWIASRRPATIARLAGNKVVSPVAAAGAWRIFRAGHDGDYFAVGSGRVEAARNRLQIWSTAAGAPVVVRYHYHPRMRVRGGSGLGPHAVAGAALPFIEVQVEAADGAVIEIR